MNTNPIPDAIFERLYFAAERLERDWANVEMSGLFLPRRIEDAWRLLTQRGIDPAWTEDECAAHAERLLHYVWERNAVRDYIRQRDARTEGRRGPSVSLSLPGLENHPALWVLLDSGQSRDPWDSMLLHELAKALLRRGIPEKQIWAFYWFVVGEEEWNDVAMLLKKRLGVEVQANALRQWPKRCFERIVVELRALLAEEGGAPADPKPSARPSARIRSTNRPASPSGANNPAAPSPQNRVTRSR